MQFNGDVISELELLASFNLDSTMSGIKIHKDAEPAVIAASERLFQKRLITQVDGGYLTELGRATAEHLQEALRILRSD